MPICESNSNDDGSYKQMLLINNMYSIMSPFFINDF